MVADVIYRIDCLYTKYMYIWYKYIYSNGCMRMSADKVVYRYACGASQIASVFPQLSLRTNNIWIIVLFLLILFSIFFLPLPSHFTFHSFWLCFNFIGKLYTTGRIAVEMDSTRKAHKKCNEMLFNL